MKHHANIAAGAPPCRGLRPLLPTALVTLALILGASGCSKSNAVGTAAPEGEVDYAFAKTMTEAERLSTAINMPEEKRRSVLTRLEKILNDPTQAPKINKRITEQGIQGVFVYRLGEGGVIVTIKNGRGLGSIASNPNMPLSLSGADLGLQVAASQEWGVGLIVGLKDPKAVFGRYKGGQKSAGAVKVASVTSLRPNKGEHRVIFIGAGSGLSLDASGATLSISPQSKADARKEAKSGERATKKRSK